MKVFQAEGKDWLPELNKFLLAYRSTNLTTTVVSSAELLFKRKLTTKLPEFDGVGDGSDVVLQQVGDRDAKKKQKAKQYAHARIHVKEN